MENFSQLAVCTNRDTFGKFLNVYGCRIAFQDVGMSDCIDGDILILLKILILI